MAKSTTEEKPQLSFRQKLEKLEKTYAQDEANRIFIPSGSIYYDWGLGGGYQTGRVYEDMAWEGAGKTTLALHAVAEAHKLGLKVVYIDSEQALDEAYAKNIGVDWDNKDCFALFQPDCGEDGFDYARAMMETGEVRLLILDSINGLLPRKMLEDPAGTVNMGLHARLLGQEIPKIKSFAHKYNVAVIAVSQLREKIGVMFGSPETTQGGHALKFFSSVRTDLRKVNVTEGTQKDVVSMKTKFKIIKNKIVSPYRKGEIPISFGIGIDKLQEVINLGKEYDLLKLRAGVVTFDNVKYNEDEFKDMLDSNPEFYLNIRGQIINLLNDNPTIELAQPNEL